MARDRHAGAVRAQHHRRNGTACGYVEQHSTAVASDTRACLLVLRAGAHECDYVEGFKGLSEVNVLRTLVANPLLAAKILQVRIADGSVFDQARARVVESWLMNRLSSSNAKITRGTVNLSTGKTDNFVPDGSFRVVVFCIYLTTPRSITAASLQRLRSTSTSLERNQWLVKHC